MIKYGSKVIKYGSKVIKYGSKEYTVKYEEIQKEELQDIIKKHSDIKKMKDDIKLGNIVNIQTDAESNLQLGSKYYLKRNEVNTYLFQMVDSDGVIVLNNARVKQGTQEYKNSNELTLIIDKYEGLSKNQKYDKWIGKVC